MCAYIQDNYSSSDINLKIETKDNQTILKYFGTATTLNNEEVDFNKEVICDFVLDASINYK